MYPDAALKTCRRRQEMPSLRASLRQDGFSIVAAIFLIVILAGLGLGILTVTGLQHSESAQDVQGVRAYQAARAGVEWAMYALVNPDGPPSATLPACWSGNVTVSPGGSLAGFTVLVTCTQTNSPTTELNENVAVYSITSIASSGAPGGPNSIVRSVSVTLSRCTDPTNSPSFQC